jgi:hypothetical protein
MLVKDEIATELSLGYSVEVEHTGQKLQAGAKSCSRSRSYIQNCQEHEPLFCISGAHVLFTQSNNACKLHV